MLQTIRDKITGVVAMRSWAPSASCSSSGASTSKRAHAPIAAKVDGEQIPVETVQRAWQQRQSQLQQMLRDELPPDMVKSQQAALLDQFVQQ